MSKIEKIAVIGAGVMGAGIAAHAANAGADVLLLDIVPDGAANRNEIAEGAIARMLRADPAPFMHRTFAKRVTPGNIEDDLDRLADRDWIIEAVIERADIKQDLYRKIDAVRKQGSVVSSNTSTLPLSVLTDGMGNAFARDFMITHFFNPPRYMRLLEIVAGPATRDDAVAAIRAFADRRMGKSVVPCHDTPGFIANRIGTYWLQCAVTQAMDRGITVEEADAAMGRPAGIPRTGVFGLIDMVGLDLMPHVLKGLAGALPESDAFHAIYREHELIEKLIADGYTGRKGKGGFYRLNDESGERVKEALDLGTGEYAPAARPKLDSVKAGEKNGLRAMLEHSEPAGQYAWQVWSRTLAYAASLVPEIADDIAAIDEAMRLGYNWRWGPFELIDRLGPAWFAERLRADGLDTPPLLDAVGDGKFYREEDGRLRYFATDGTYRDLPRPDGTLLLSDIRRKSQPVAKNRAASLWDIGDGVLCLEFHSKMNALGLGALAMIRKAVAIVPGRYRGLVIHNEARNFSVGANIGLLLPLAFLRAGFLVRWLVGKGQGAYGSLKYAPFPVVGAPSGMALGGGCEILLHCDAVQAHAESYIGLVETGVGLVPGWGGCKELLTRRWADRNRPGGPMPPISRAFETVSVATVAKSAFEARDHAFLRDEDGITMNRDRLLADARAKVLALAEGYAPPDPIELSLPGRSAKAALSMAVDGFRKRGLATPHDVTVAGALATVLSGGDTDVTETLSEDDLLALEKREFSRLACTSPTIARIRHMLATGKPLRN
ncbi:MAG: 3-hydroxyacyl-CoA dehydrogenase NAD-binding domain-containing protein [Rhodospirillaceae bacterium]